MTTAVKEKKPFLPQRKPTTSTAVALPGNRVPSSRGTASVAPLTIGGEPRVHLLPMEVSARKHLKAIKRRLWMAVVVIVAIAAVAYGGTVLSLTAAQAQLDSANGASGQLVAQQAKYGEVSKVKSDITAIGAAQKTATSKEILWAPYIAQLQASLPAGADIVSLNGQIDTANTATAAPAAVPLQSSHIATLTVSAKMGQATIASWVASLPTIKGFVDATPDSVTIDATGGYLVEVTILMDSSSLSNRFAKAVK